MRRILQVTGFIFGLMVLISLGVLYKPRQEVSGAYWLFESGYISGLNQPALHRMLPDGRGRTPILFDEIPFQSLMWQFDARYLFYVSHDESGFGVRRLSIDGREEQTVIESYPAEIAFTRPQPLSPDGKYMIFGFYGGTVANRIIRIDSVGTHAEVIYEGELGSFDDLIWSPDSQWIYFSAYDFDDRHESIYKLSVDGTRLENLIPFETFSNPVWVMDGQQLLFSDRASFWRMGQDGGNLEWLFDIQTIEYIGSNVIDTEGVILAITGVWGAQSAIQIDIMTGEMQQLISNVEWITLPVLSDDGNWLVFAAIIDGVRSVYRMRFDGTDMQHLYVLGGNDRHIKFEFTTDDRWLIVSYVDQTQIERRTRRIQINMENRRVENMPDGWAIHASPLIDLAWNIVGLVGIGGVLMGISVGGSLIIGRWRRK